MLIYNIASKKHSPNNSVRFSKLEVTDIAGARLSFITAMRIATECKKNTPDVIFTHSLSDATAAASAQSLDTHSSLPYPIVLFIDYKTKIPRSINRSIASKIQAVVYDSEITRKNWSAVININIPPLHTVIWRAVECTRDNNDTCESKTKPEIIFSGTIEKKSPLADILDAIAEKELQNRIKVTVYGTGKGNYVMPMVRRAKANRIDVEWMGENLEKNFFNFNFQGFIPANQCHTESEIKFLAKGIPEVNRQNLTEWLSPEKRVEMVENAKASYLEKHTPEAYEKSILNLLEKISNKNIT